MKALRFCKLDFLSLTKEKKQQTKSLLTTVSLELHIGKGEAVHMLGLFNILRLSKYMCKYM